MADDFRFANPSGGTLQLSDYRGKVVIMQFLYTTCSHCQDTARMLSTLEKDFGPRGLQVIGIAFNPEAAQPPAIDEFIRNNRVNFPVGSAPAEKVLGYLGISLVDRYVVPQIVVIDRQGMIRAQTQRLGSPELQDEAQLRSLVDGLLKEPPIKQTSRRGR